jgi:hypothetical protein
MNIAPFRFLDRTSVLTVRGKNAKEKFSASFPA